MIITQIGGLLGFTLNAIENFFNYEIVGIFLTIINFLAIGMFFAILTHKATSLKNPDSRRRLKLMATGTIASMLPLFLLFLYRIFSGAKGSLFDIVPMWIAVFSLLMLLLFPTTMAYVIVVQRAMNVSVVVRQGLQYALAKNGVLVLQILLSIGVILTAFSFASDNTTNRPQKITFIAVGIASVFLIRLLADKIKVWVDKKFFREAYNAEQILTELSEEVRTMVETKPLLEKVSNKISESMHVPQVVMLLRNGDSFQPAYAVGYEGLPSVALDKNDKTIGKISNNESLVIYQDVFDYWVNEEIQTVEKEALEKLNSQLLLPIGVKNELAGLISLSPKLSEEPFTPNDLRLLKSVASQTGLALENSRLTATIAKEAAQKERLNRELEIAREVQERLFPQEKPEIEGLDYHGECRTALDVGGDYYDFLEFDDGRFGIAIGDISGKGIGASLMMASLQASLRGQSLHFKNDLAGLMSQINHLLYDASTSNRYATFFYSQYNPKTRNLIYVTAGHDPPYLLRKNGDELEVIKLDKGGPVVGMLPPMLVEYEQGEITLQKGDLIVSSTDGITEAMNPKEEEWGEKAMFAELKKVYGKSAKEVAEHIIFKADEFANGAKQHDDMTMIVVRVI
jgi:sigma-B regulation protein RsbU (phosphoserine phosphatase)